MIRITTVPVSLKVLLKGQLRFMSSYYDVVAVSSGGPCFEEMLAEEGVRGVVVPMTRRITPLRDSVALFRLIVLFLKEKPDIVHTHTPKAGLLGMLAARIARVPVRLHTVAGLPLLVATGRKKWLLTRTEKLTSACATAVYPNSLLLGQIMLRNKLAAPGKTRVIANGSSNGIDTTYFSPDASFEKIACPFRFTFCFIGRIVKDKGIHELIEAFVRLHREYPGCGLLLVGDFESRLDPVLPETEAIIRHHPGIEFSGWQNDVRPYLAAADVLVFPSYREGFPNVVMQAGAMGLPSIVTDINGCNEIVTDGVNGRIVPPKQTGALYEAMKDLLVNPGLRKRMAEQSRPAIVARYERTYVWNALLEEYRHRVR